MIKYSAKFSKKDQMVYISHLDLMKLFRRAIRRADLPYVLTGGYTPRVKISMPFALKLGKESEEEQLDFWLTEERVSDGLLKAFNGELPEGIRVFDIVKI